ncbi:uncharacterized protein LOC119735986 [Patiria miniata]|uniref:Uncharacterized protein n=1 Tax=Patiria miniata TaxID=46514 RepID=A0A914APE5_PATMI|nr:uncharacterized protein LOC119735986 [Patiria miniata]
MVPNSLIGTIASTDEDCKSALETSLVPLYTQLDTFRSHLDAVIGLVVQNASEWQLVFKGVARTGVGLYNMWTAASWDDNTMGVNGSWRDESLHDGWKSGELSVRRVNLSLYGSEGDRVDLIFNGTGTDIHSWFTQERLISSPWQDLNSSATPNYFSIEGDKSKDRHFVINNNYGGCGVDKGWLVVTNSNSSIDCAWERPATEYTYPIMYSRLESKVRWHSVLGAGDVTVGLADFLTIQIDT